MFLAIDPGSAQSAIVYMDGGKPVEYGIYQNDDLVSALRLICTHRVPPQEVVVEMIASYGMAVGAEVFETCVWIGRFTEAATAKTYRLFRNEIKNHLCHSSKANDANIRQALIDRFGGKEKALGKKKTPGPLYGVHADIWAALAVACTWHDTRAQRVPA